MVRNHHFLFVFSVVGLAVFMRRPRDEHRPLPSLFDVRMPTSVLSFTIVRYSTHLQIFGLVKVYPLDAVYDVPEDVPEDVKTNKRYAGLSGFTIQEVAEQIKADYGTVRKTARVRCVFCSLCCDSFEIGAAM